MCNFDENMHTTREVLNDTHRFVTSGRHAKVGIQLYICIQIFYIKKMLLRVYTGIVYRVDSALVMKNFDHVWS